MRMPFVFRSAMFILRAAGFMAIRTSTVSPGVKTSCDENCTWNPLTPGSVPAGARISAGKSGNVAKIVSVQGNGVCELAARNLHAVAGVSAKAEDGFINDFALVCADDWVRNRSHGLEMLQFLIMNFNHPVCPKDNQKRLPSSPEGFQ